MLKPDKKKKNLQGLRDLRIKLRKSCLSTVCEEARCPNISECFSEPAATFLILGDICTRSCRFCSVLKGKPDQLDVNEPENVAEAAFELGLKHVVITSVTRDDLPDFGAQAFARTIKEIRKKMPDSTIEVLTPDFRGSIESLETVLDATPDVFNHNMETIGRLYSKIRPEADLETSLNLLKTTKDINPLITTKSGFMAGLGETEEEICELILMLASNRVDIVTIGQYMQPAKNRIEVEKHWDEAAFGRWAHLAKEAGIGYCVSGPFVRSSYQAKKALDEILKRRT